MLEKDSSGVNFDSNVGSTIFSIKLHVNIGVSVGVEYFKNENFDDCVYLLKPTDNARDTLQQKFKELNDKTVERTKANMLDHILKELTETQIDNQEGINEKIKSIIERTQSENMIQIIKENGQILKNTIDSLKYEVVLNKHQY